MSDEENCGLVCCWSLKNPEVKKSITSVCTTIPVHVSTLIDMTCTSSVQMCMDVCIHPISFSSILRESSMLLLVSLLSLSLITILTS